MFGAVSPEKVLDGFALTTILGYKKLWEIGFKGLYFKVLGSYKLVKPN